MKRGLLLATALLGAACAQRQARLDPVDLDLIRTGPLELSFGAAPPGPQAAVWGAQARSLPSETPFGRLSAQAGYEVLAGDARARQRTAPSQRGWQGTLGTQRTGQSLTAQLPAFLGQPLHLSWSAQQEQGFGAAGAFARRSRGATARWAPGPFSFALTPSGVAHNQQLCFVDARLQQSSTAFWQRPVLSLQRCATMDVLSGAADWDLGLSSSRLRLSGLEPQGGARGPGTRLELGGEHRLDWGPWALQGDWAWQPGRQAAHDAAMAGSRARLSRTFWRTPLTASWQRNQPGLWGLPSTTAAGREVALGVDFASRLRDWLGTAAAARLSYRWLHADDPLTPDDDRIVMDVSFGW